LFFYSHTSCTNLSSSHDKSDDNKPGSSKAAINKNYFLRQVLLNADTVMLTSHIGLEANKLLGKNIGEPWVLPPLLVKDKINREIIVESKIIQNEALDSIINILTKTQTQYSGPYKCGFDPHHTIFIIYQGKISYIDLCFSCFYFSASTDLEKLGEIGDAEWMELKKYFRIQGFRYRVE
jgi:hypothetical protein